jgi:hypothetical protein
VVCNAPVLRPCREFGTSLRRKRGTREPLEFLAIVRHVVEQGYPH